MITAPFNDKDKDEFCKILSIHRTPYFRGIKGIKDGYVVCGAGFDNWSPNSCVTHVWIRSPGDLTRKFIKDVFTYLFITCNLGVVIGITPCNNVAALRFNKKLGWKEVYRIKDGYALGTDSAIQEMRREDCRWIDREVSEWAANQALPHRQTSRLLPKSRVNSLNS